jgi:hypothetical protein
MQAAKSGLDVAMFPFGHALILATDKVENQSVLGWSFIAPPRRATLDCRRIKPCASSLLSVELVFTVRDVPRLSRTVVLDSGLI